MMRLLGAVLTLTLFAVPFLAAPIKPVAAVGALGLLLAAVGLGGLWRWPVTAAACVFVTEYTVALWVARDPLNLPGALTFGLALVVLLASVELGRGVRRATVELRARRSQLAAWLSFAVSTLALTLIGLAIARGLVGAIPFAAAPFVAGLAAVGVVVALAALVRDGKAPPGEV